MQAIVPLFFASPPEAAFWSRSPGRDHVRRLVAVLAGMPVVEAVYVLARDTAPWQDLAGGVVSVREAGGPSADPGTVWDRAAWLARTAAALDLREETVLLCLDARNPGLTETALATAVASRDSGGRPLVLGLRAVHDHPCQCVRYARLVEAGLLRRRDALPGDAPDQGRAVFAKAVGLPDVRVILAPTTPGAPSLTLAVDPATGSATFPETALAGCDRLAYALLQATTGGAHDLVEPVPPVDGLWGHDGLGRPITPGGQRILGRQEFPPLFACDATILLGRPAALRQARRLAAEGRAGGVPLAQPVPAIDTEQDARYVRCLLLTLAKAAPAAKPSPPSQENPACSQ